MAKGINLILSFLIVFLVSCKHDTKQIQSVGDKIGLDSLDYVIDYEIYDEINGFELSLDDVYTARNILKSHFDTIDCNTIDSVPYLRAKHDNNLNPYHFEEYLKQYVGVKESGKKKVYIFLVANDNDALRKWMEERKGKLLYYTKDGGIMAIDVVIDLDSQRIESFDIHGYG